MSDDRLSFSQRLLESQHVTPALRAAFNRELDEIFHETPGLRNRATAITLLVIALGIVVGEIQALFVYQEGLSFYVGAATMLIAGAAAAVWTLHDLCQPKIVKKSAHKVNEMFYGAVSLLMVTTLLHGLDQPSHPASTFGAFYVFVFLFVCSMWAIGSRILVAEMAMKEQMLRLECRLADLAEGPKKIGDR